MANVFLNYLLFALGFALLVKGANWLIDGSVSFARRLCISEIIIGLTVVAFGTSAPELVVNIVSSVRGSSDLVVGNIVGSNIANIALVLGVAGLIAPLAVKKELVKKEIFLGIIGAAAIYLLAVKSGETLTLGRISGGILLTGFTAFLWLIYRSAKSGEMENVEKHKLSLFAAIGLAVGGLTGLAVGGQLVVGNAIVIAENFGISQSLIGLTLVALGTSLPELVTSIVAIKKNKSDIAIGNAVGSNIFNIFWVLGLSAVIRPIVFDVKLKFDIIVLGIVTLLFVALIFIGKKYKISKWQSAVLLAGYIGYLGFIIWRG